MKLKFLVIVFFISCFIGISSSLKAETFYCFISFDTPNGPCQGLIEYNYTPPSPPNGNARLDFVRITFRVSCGKFVDYHSPTFWVDIQNAMINNLYTRHPAVFPPCGGQAPYVVFEIGQINCLKFINNPSNFTLSIVGCDLISSCYNYFSVCLNTLTYPYHLQKTYLYTALILNECPPWMDPTIHFPPTGLTFDDPWESGCMAPASCGNW